MTRTKRFVALALLCVSLAEAEETWRELRSPNFLMVSNATEASATSVLSRLERFRFTLARVLLNRRLAEELATQVYGFRDFDSLEPFLPITEERGSSVAGYFRSGVFKNVIALDLSPPRGRSRASSSMSTSISFSASTGAAIHSGSRKGSLSFTRASASTGSERNWGSPPEIID